MPTPSRSCSAKGAGPPRSCWSASNRATTRIVRAIRSSGRPDECCGPASTKPASSARRRLRNERGQALQARAARQTAAAQESDGGRGRGVPPLARRGARRSEAGSSWRSAPPPHGRCSAGRFDRRQPRNGAFQVARSAGPRHVPPIGGAASGRTGGRSETRSSTTCAGRTAERAPAVTASSGSAAPGGATATGGAWCIRRSSRSGWWFEHYSTLFDTVELNIDLLPAADARTRSSDGRQAAPQGFLYALKLGSFGSHRMKLR